MKIKIYLLFIAFCVIITTTHGYNFKLNVDGDTKCNVRYNNTNDEYKRDFKVKDNFKDIIKVSCNDNVDIDLKTYSENKEIFYEEYINVTNINYNVKKSINKPYLIEIYLRDEFKQSNKCELRVNSRKIVKTFTKKTKIKDMIFKTNTSNVVELICIRPIGEIHLYVDERWFGKELFNTEFINTNKFKINIETYKEPVKEPMEETVEIINETKNITKEIKAEIKVPVKEDNLELEKFEIINNTNTNTSNYLYDGHVKKQKTKWQVIGAVLSILLVFLVMSYAIYMTYLNNKDRFIR